MTNNARKQRGRLRHVNGLPDLAGQRDNSDQAGLPVAAWNVTVVAVELPGGPVPAVTVQPLIPEGFTPGGPLVPLCPPLIYPGSDDEIDRFAAALTAAASEAKRLREAIAVDLDAADEPAPAVEVTCSRCGCRVFGDRAAMELCVPCEKAIAS